MISARVTVVTQHLQTSASLWRVARSEGLRDPIRRFALVFRSRVKVTNIPAKKRYEKEKIANILESVATRLATVKVVVR
jgi:hypothetical protein